MDLRSPVVVAVALVGLFVGVITGIGQFLPALVRSSPTELSSATVFVSVLAFLVKPLGLLVVGYWAGTRIPVAAEYRSLLLTLGVVGGGAAAVGYLGLALVAMDGLSGAAGVNVLFSVGYNAAVQALSFAITGFAGAAFAEFRTA